MEINRKQIMETFLRILANIGDVKYQERVWIRGEGPECDDFGETINFFFDLGDPILKNYKDFDITEDQYQMLLKFRDVFDAFRDDYYDPLEFIDTPEWETIMTMAKEVVRAFNYQKDPEHFNKARQKYLLMKQIIELIFKISSYQQNEKIWMLAEQSENSDFTQIASYFLDKCKLILESYKDYGLFDYHYQALKKFYVTFEAFSKEHSFDLDFTNIPGWESVKEVARETLAVFNYTSKTKNV